MSEFQYVAFRAIDRPVPDENLEFMQRQSSRAKITPWSFENEYHYGDFRGNAIEMLRRGYDLHLHYSNFGNRKLAIRLPQGLPDPKAFQAYELEHGLQFVKDDRGPGGCLVIDPFFESGELEEIWDLGPLLNRLIPLRAEIIDGDLRPLYLAHLAVAGDGNHDPEEELDPEEQQDREEQQEGPVPAGLGNLTDAQQALAEFYGLGQSLIAAAARESPPLRERNAQSQAEEWIRRQPEAKKNAWLTALMNDPAAPVRAELLAQYRSEMDLPTWPTAHTRRTIAELYAAETEIAENLRQRKSADAAREREKRLAKMAAYPIETLQETERLVARRSTNAYREAAELLADLREALSGRRQEGLAEKQAEKLKAANPTLSRLVSELRRQGFVPK